MFDPTAFENMRVVMEGIFYDKDLKGEIKILDRNDYLNTAKLSRSYDLSFQLSSSYHQPVICKFTLTAGLENLTAELLPEYVPPRYAGCVSKLEFTFISDFNESLISEVNEALRDIWGESRINKLTVCWEAPSIIEQVIYTALVSFDRIIHEDQIEDLSEMTNYMVRTLEMLEMILDV